MKKIFHEVDTLDKKCIQKYYLSEDILMENASGALRDYIYKKFKLKQKILIVCGSGNNGADGITLARQLHNDYKVNLYLASTPTSKMAILQLQRAKSIGVKITTNTKNKYDIIVDCIFGSGLNREISDNTNTLIKKLNKKNAFKIACDIPSGLYLSQNQKAIFKANTTITMGALKTSLFSDTAKDFVGKIIIANLGISNKTYESKTNIFYLEKKDLKLPLRKKQNTHKGTFGHSCVIAGNSQNAKIGACLIALKSAMATGSGLCTIVGNTPHNQYEIMSSADIPNNCNALAIGMGLGDTNKQKINKIKKFIFENKIPCVVDADMFYTDDILDFLQYKKTILTPHPKEFISLLAISNIAKISTNSLANNRLFYVKEFIKKYPKVTLLLKGANTIIANKNKIYIQNLGSSSLSKGGMGDVLAGIILSLLSQGYSSKQSAINGSLIHSLCAKKYKGNNYSLTPKSLIKQIKKLDKK
ncbi:NAD(P)HX epimerase / NAD(P)HX dehydratase [hydrothermal vent metagenome]|uniref:Nicotinamide nucleotide repair protein n=1 Tax=hydrothermal vent metagenome TaxID=652676 RepID=A0A3B1E8Y5_9ZZZZ